MGILQGKTAVVTGASRGIGLGIARVLAREGADLVVHATRTEHLDVCRKLVEREGVGCVAASGDAADSGTAQALVDAAMERLGRLDIVVGCAGLNRDGMLHKLSDDAWNRVLAVNLSGIFYLTRAAAQVMRTQHAGRIIHISSVARHGNPGTDGGAGAGPAGHHLQCGVPRLYRHRYDPQYSGLRPGEDGFPDSRPPERRAGGDW